MTAQSTDILWLKTISKEDEYTTGTKATTFGTLLQEGFPLPDGFVVTAAAYFHFLHENKLIPKVNQLLTTINYDHPESVLQVATHVQKLLLATKLSEAFTTDITKAYHKLNGAFMNAPVVVHISPTHTHSPSLSQTYRDIHGDTNLMVKIKHAWASLFAPAMILHRQHKHIDHFQQGVAVIVQKMIAPEVSGTMMTIDPVTHDKTHLIVETTGEVIDHYVVDKISDDNKIIQKHIAGETQILSDATIHVLTQLGKKLEKHLYFPQEISFALEKGTIYLLNCKTLHVHHLPEDTEQPKTNLPILLKGIPASRGIGTGRVKLIHHQSDVEKIMRGDIVVASELTSYHKHLLQKAAGIVTDQGGRTSPIALFAREHGIPAIVGTHHATKTLTHEHVITINGTNGEIYKGTFTGSQHPRQTVTQLFTTISDLTRDETNEVSHTDGVLLLPQKTLPNQTKLLSALCENFTSCPVLYRLPDPLAEGINELIGFRGTYRLLHEHETLKNELAAIKKVTSEAITTNLQLLLPFVRSTHEVTAAKHLLETFGLSRSHTFKLWIELATPASILSLNHFIESGIDGVVIDIDTLSMLLLGIDKNQSEITHAYDVLDPAVLKTLEEVIKTAQKHGINTSIYGHALVHHSALIEKLVTWGITSIAIEDQHIDEIKKQVIETERRMIEHQQ